MKCLLVLLAALFVAGCSVGVTHQTEDEHHSEKSSAVERSRTAVAVGLNETTPHHEPKVPNATQSPFSERSTTIVKVISPESSPEVIEIPLPSVPRRLNRMIQVTGNGNTVVFGDLHIHRHEHVHIHQAPKPAPVRINVRVEDRVSARERRRRMVEARIARFFPRYRD